MHSMKTIYTILILFVFTIFLVVSNCTIRPVRQTVRPELLAHRGLAQTFDIEKVKWDTNTAAMIYPPEHSYIENTIPSMNEAFKCGANIVEFDIRVTKDKQLAVFHDYTVESRTEKEGNVADYTLAELKEMDVGYGYTADNGQTYPLRNSGRTLLPSFDEVIQNFPDKNFLVHIRDGGKEIGELLLSKLNTMKETQVAHISIYGNDEAINLIKAKYPEMKVLSIKIMKKAIIEYELIGWTGYIPKSIRNIEIHIPIEYAKYLWGWPSIFVNRMKEVNTRVVIVKKKGHWSGGFDSVDDMKRIPDSYSGFIWTDRIDRIGNYYNS